MELTDVDEALLSCQILAIPYPEWFSFLKSDPKPDNIQFLTIPNVIPSEKERSKDFEGFVKAVFTKMEAPVDSILDAVPKPNLILADSFLPWAVSIGERRNIPVASFWPMSLTIFSIVCHHQLLLANGHFEANLTGIVTCRIDMSKKHLNLNIHSNIKI
ncbi:hypothetical protein H5410_007022 [Solanum commersonii]|uniref:Uncharacterized protein n=1 Tax=Solanum commersonii TaxID=4109 RepID=A0A9J6ABW0_SOLCO|nr:hypothetical protein H5410_007022 [Solanum commersonii]